MSTVQSANTKQDIKMGNTNQDSKTTSTLPSAGSGVSATCGLSKADVKETERTHHSKDAKWLKYDARLLKETCTFEKAKEQACLQGHIQLKQGMDAKEMERIHKTAWKMEMDKWMVDAGRDVTDDPPQFAGMAMYVATLPFEMLHDTHKLSTNQLEKINWFRLYYGLGNIQWIRAPSVSYDGSPFYPPAFQQWMNNNHNSCTWWINYSCYERQNGLPELLQTTQK